MDAKCDYFSEINTAIEQLKSDFNRDPRKVRMSREVFTQVKETIAGEGTDEVEVTGESFKGIPMEVIEEVNNPFLVWSVE